VQSVGDVVALSAGLRGREQGAELLSRDPGGEDVQRRVTVDECVPHRREGLVQQPFPLAQQPASVGPDRVPDVGASADPGSHRGVGVLDKSGDGVAEILGAP